MSTELRPERAESTAPPGRHRSKAFSLLHIGFAIGLVAVLTVAALAMLLVWPRSGAVVPADAIVVPSGDPGARLDRALELIARGVAPTLVLVGTPDFGQVDRLCGAEETFEVVCLRPEPDNTRNEARAVGQLAEERRWRSIILVTSSIHMSRAGMLFRRCFDGKVVTVGVEVLGDVGFGDAVRGLAHEAAGLAYATAARQC